MQEASRRGREITRELAKRLPVGVGILGRERDAVLSVLDRVFQRKDGQDVIDIGGATLSLDLSQGNERLLSYCFFNVLRHYKKSALYRYMRGIRRAPSDAFIDIGANLGIYSLLARELGFKTALFEPEPRHFTFLKRNEGAFGSVHPVALSDTDGTAEFFVASETNLGASSLVMSNKGWEGSVYTGREVVRVARFDAYLDELAIAPEKIRLLKIDVEGNEHSTVRGLEGFLASGNAPDIWCEVRGPDSDRNPNSYRAVSNFLAPHGYEPFRCSGDSRTPFRGIEATDPGVFDLLFRSQARRIS